MGGVSISEPVKILCTGDLHLGRHPAKIPDSLDDSNFSPGRLWLAIVEESINLNVDIVVITGDIIDRRNRYFEAFGDFEAGLNKLTRADIPVNVIAGNHDFDVLPELVANLSDYDINQLGSNGEWDAAKVEADDKIPLRLVGWSFPHRHVDYNPLEKLDLEFSDDLPIIGVLHGELGRPDSHYAPVSESELERTGYDGWLLGHIHNPSLRDDLAPFVLIPGTPQPLDPTEPGLHGPWILTVDEGGISQIDHSPLANLRYESISIDAGEIEKLEEVPARFYSKTEEIIEGSSHQGIKLLVTTLKLTGRTAIYGELEEISEQLGQDLHRESGNTEITVESVINRTRPSIDLEKISQGDNPPAVIAELLLKLKKGNKEDLPEELLDRTKDALTEAYYANAYSLLRTHGDLTPPGKGVSIEVLKHQAWKILDRLLSQPKT